MAEREERVGELLLGEAEEEPGLILGEVGWALENPAAARGVVFVYSVMAGGDTLGAHAQTAATDLQNGGAYVLDMMSYIFAVGAGIAAGYTFWQYHKNPNGQHKLGYAIGSLVVAGFFAALPSFINFSAQTVSGTNGAVNGTSALTYQNGG